MEADERLASSEGTDSSSDDGSISDAELMVNSRARRATAGNRYGSLIAQEEAGEDEEDEVAMLFAEEEGEGEDEEYNSAEGDDDGDMSSSDDDDQGPNAVADDVEGEKELEKEAKAERARKRKADLALTTVASLKKKPRIDPTSLRRAPIAKPTKRKERVSWLPNQDSAPGRTSLRKQTILHRAETHAKLKENEAQRLKLKARREKREKEREAAAPTELTQADRLAEAERVERRNAKSLNRWEAMEKKRAEEQAAKLAALKERKLEGAVVTWYSSSAKYYGHKEVKEPEVEVPTEAKKRGRKSKAYLEQMAAAKLASEQAKASSSELAPVPGLGPESSVSASSTQVPTAETQPQITFTTPQGPGNFFLTGIHEYASMSSDSNAKPDSAQTTSIPPTVQIEAQQISDAQATPPDSKTQSLITKRDQTTPGTGTPLSDGEVAKANVDVLLSNQVAGEIDSQKTAVTGAAVLGVAPNVANANDDPTSSTSYPMTQRPEAELVSLQPSTTPVQGDDHVSLVGTEPAKPPAQLIPSVVVDQEVSAVTPMPKPLIEVISTRNLVILDKFDDLTGQGRQDFGLFYNHRKTAKPIKHSQELCPITGLVAKYRDPTTGIGYANTAAYKKLQELRNYQFGWSSMLGCYTGRTSVVARGVPEGFSES